MHVDHHALHTIDLQQTRSQIDLDLPVRGWRNLGGGWDPAQCSHIVLDVAGIEAVPFLSFRDHVHALFDQVVPAPEYVATPPTPGFQDVGIPAMSGNTATA